MKATYILSLTLVATVFALSGCSKNNEEASNNVTSAAVDDLTNISNGFAPASLSYSSVGLAVTSGGIAQSQSGNPCAAYTGPTAIFDCQPVLLRLYIDMSKQFLDMAKLMIGELGTNIGNVADGATGTVTVGTQTVTFSKTNATNYSVLAKEGSNSVVFVSVADNVYTIQLDFSKMAAGSVDASAPSQFEIKVTYTDADTWSIVTTGLGMACQADDVRAPRRMKIGMAKANGLWKGKAMLYNGVWANGIGGGSEPTCDTADSDAGSMALYTDFVGDSSAAKASVYMMKRTVSSVGSFAQMKDFCTTYGIGGCGVWFNSANFTNPFCNLSTTTTATWNSSCGSVSPSVSVTDFGSASDWVVPSDFANGAVTNITLPTSI